MRLQWYEGAPAGWEERLRRVPRSNLLQSFAYGRAMRLTRQLMPRFGLICEGEQEIGLCLVQEASLLGAHAVVIDRGPLWYQPGNPDRDEAFAALVARLYPRRLMRFRRFMPEFPADPTYHDLMTRQGFRLARKDQIGQRSLWIDLTRDDVALRAGLRSNWRQHLAQAERSTLTIEVDRTGALLPFMLNRYAADKTARGYPGPHPSLLRTIALPCFASGSGLVLRALHQGHAVASVLILGHGRSATYQAGWSGEAGRKLSAHHLLLWRAFGTLRAQGYRDFDLGGINPEQAEGVTIFKKGMGGEAYELLPIYR